MLEESPDSEQTNSTWSTFPNDIQFFVLPHHLWVVFYSWSVVPITEREAYRMHVVCMMKSRRLKNSLKGHQTLAPCAKLAHTSELPQRLPIAHIVRSGYCTQIEACAAIYIPWVSHLHWPHRPLAGAGKTCAQIYVQLGLIDFRFRGASQTRTKFT